MADIEINLHDTIGVTDNVSVKTINHAIEISNEIPSDAKKALKDFVEDNFNEILNNLDNITNLNVPSELVDLLPSLEQIIKAILG